jgi:hypothetical protein
MSKLSDFMKQNKIGVRQLLSTSHKLESRSPTDRAVAAARKAAKAAAAPEAVKEKAKQKPKSGKPVTPRAIDAALAGKAVAGPAKTRITRAVNAVLTRKKKPEITFRDLF